MSFFLRTMEPLSFKAVVKYSLYQKLPRTLFTLEIRIPFYYTSPDLTVSQLYYLLMSLNKWWRSDEQCRPISDATASDIGQLCFLRPFCTNT